MFIRVEVEVYMKVADEDEAEQGCSVLNSGLDHALAGYPGPGRFLTAAVLLSRPATESEITDRELAVP